MSVPPYPRVRARHDFFFSKTKVLTKGREYEVFNLWYRFSLINPAVNEQSNGWFFEIRDDEGTQQPWPADEFEPNADITKLL